MRGRRHAPRLHSEFQLVDERIVGRKPAKLAFAEAAALPLTTITAWEALFERLGLLLGGDGTHGRSLLIIGGAGGVGSITIQLGKLAGLTVIATASRPETVKWVLGLGADHAVDHRQPLAPQLAAIGHKEVDYIANFANTDSYWAAMAGLIKPEGHIVSIVDNTQPIDLRLLKPKSASFSWEFMFTPRDVPDARHGRQGALLDEVAVLIDSGKPAHHAQRDAHADQRGQPARRPRQAGKRQGRRQDHARGLVTVLWDRQQGSRGAWQTFWPISPA